MTWKKYRQISEVHTYILALLVIIISVEEVTSCSISMEFPHANLPYVCKCCPSAILKCSFTKKPILVLWAAPSERIFDVRGEVGHTVDSTKSAMGEATLTVNASSDLMSVYACTAFYNGTSEGCDYQMNPDVEDDLEFNFTANPGKYYMDIMSKHLYRECYQNTNISCLDSNGMLVEEMSNAPSMARTNVPLWPNSQYTVTLTAMHSGQQMYNTSITVRTDFPTGEVVGFCIAFIFIFFILTVVAVLLWRCIKHRRSRISESQEGTPIKKIVKKKEIKQTKQEEESDVSAQGTTVPQAVSVYRSDEDLPFGEMAFWPQQPNKQHERDASSDGGEKA